MNRALYYRAICLLGRVLLVDASHISVVSCYTSVYYYCYPVYYDYCTELLLSIGQIKHTVFGRVAQFKHTVFGRIAQVCTISKSTHNFCVEDLAREYSTTVLTGKMHFIATVPVLVYSSKMYHHTCMHTCILSSCSTILE